MITQTFVVRIEVEIDEEHGQPFLVRHDVDRLIREALYETGFGAKVTTISTSDNMPKVED